MKKLILLYLITSRLAFLRSPEITYEDLSRLQLEAIDKAARAGCRLIQVREKDMGAKALAAFTRAAVERARPHGARVLVNDRLDVAMAAGADGVHLRASSIPVREVRDMAAKKGLDDFLIGVSTHSAAEARSAEEGGADFIVCGPVFDTPSREISALRSASNASPRYWTQWEFRCWPSAESTSRIIVSRCGAARLASQPSTFSPIWTVSNRPFDLSCTLRFRNLNQSN
jgi:thiamine-phosphate diphosphorylase